MGSASSIVPVNFSYASTLEVASQRVPEAMMSELMYAGKPTPIRSARNSSAPAQMRMIRVQH
jgi:hypothetical protein